MNLLDHNFPENQLPQLQNRRIHFRKIGRDIGQPAWDDWGEIRRLLHRLKQPTFFTRDNDFYHPKYRHSGHCIVFLDVPVLQSADYVYRFLRHPSFRTKRLRMGKVVRVSTTRLSYWQLKSNTGEIVEWVTP